jgi:hypothetical protein
MIDHFPNRLPQQCFGNDSDVPRIFILNFTSTSGPHAQGEYLVFDMEDFKAHAKAVVLVSTKEVVQPSLNGLLLDLLQSKLVHLAKTTITKLKPTPPKKFLCCAACMSVMQYTLFPFWNSAAATSGVG